MVYKHNDIMITNKPYSFVFVSFLDNTLILQYFIVSTSWYLLLTGGGGISRSC